MVVVVATAVSVTSGATRPSGQPRPAVRQVLDRYNGVCATLQHADVPLGVGGEGRGGFAELLGRGDRPMRRLRLAIRCRARRSSTRTTPARSRCWATPFRSASSTVLGRRDRPRHDLQQGRPCRARLPVRNLRGRLRPAHGARLGGDPRVGREPIGVGPAPARPLAARVARDDDRRARPGRDAERPRRRPAPRAVSRLRFL